MKSVTKSFWPFVHPSPGAVGNKHAQETECNKVVMEGKYVYKKEYITYELTIEYQILERKATIIFLFYQKT